MLFVLDHIEQIIVIGFCGYFVLATQWDQQLYCIRVLQRAVKKWNNHQNLNFVINFGDIVDGKCPPDQSLDVVKKVNNEFQKFNGPVFHLIGNHCLYNLPRDKLLPLLKIPGLNGHAYYDFFTWSRAQNSRTGWL
uniref:Calcineurin-like phosphoesterase domain-containing protein n=1 Tax=Populus trichocarpa TaxID=3694 RepID=A0A3N7HU34_POPTR